MREIRLYNGKAFGHEVSKYGLEHGYLDYFTLSKIVGDCILNNTIREETSEDWDVVSGEFDEAIFQDYVISESGYKFLEEYTDELVLYDYILDVYEKHSSQDFDYSDEMKHILDYLNEHGTILVKPLTIEKLYYEFSEDRYWVSWMSVDENILEEFSNWLDAYDI